MGKKARLSDRTPQPAFVTLRDLPGTRVVFWMVSECPYCAGQHLHVAGNLRNTETEVVLGEVPAPCDMERTYVLSLPPRPKKRKGRRSERRERHEAWLDDPADPADGWDED
ncbi:hypothetical protein [Deinococcus enclensis]|uniref:Uncharacterized protein n=1 Tax=Deinococcus enclensis TaxID=1049582 RepID=A0ABT9MBC0_9DEIO|nr:hypothetical protein [Deinococcus enclensis]MDP9763890.1 hypothetical protein [Deinococcus enclensis]